MTQKSSQAWTKAISIIRECTANFFFHSLAVSILQVDSHLYHSTVKVKCAYSVLWLMDCKVSIKYALIKVLKFTFFDIQQFFNLKKVLNACHPTVPLTEVQNSSSNNPEIKCSQNEWEMAKLGRFYGWNIFVGAKSFLFTLSYLKFLLFLWIITCSSTYILSDSLNQLASMPWCENAFSEKKWMKHR